MKIENKNYVNAKEAPRFAQLFSSFTKQTTDDFFERRTVQELIDAGMDPVMAKDMIGLFEKNQDDLNALSWLLFENQRNADDGWVLESTSVIEPGHLSFVVTSTSNGNIYFTVTVASLGGQFAPDLLAARKILVGWLEDKPKLKVVSIGAERAGFRTGLFKKITALHEEIQQRRPEAYPAVNQAGGGKAMGILLNIPCEYNGRMYLISTRYLVLSEYIKTKLLQKLPLADVLPLRARK